MSDKNKVVEMEIVEMQFPNIGIGYYEGKKVSVKNTISKQKVSVRLKRKRKSWEGYLLSVIERSPEEVKPLCEDFAFCGGCTYQNVDYSHELEIKKDMVLDLLKKEEITDFEFLGIEEAPDIKGYRNKMEFSFGDSEKEGALALGIRKRNSFYEVVTPKNCNIIDEDYRSITLRVLEYFQSSDEAFFHKRTHEGSLRHLVIRKGKFSKEILVNLVTTDTLQTDLMPLCEILNNLVLDGKINGILHTLNNSVADVVKSEETKILYGKDFFYENLLGLVFKITPFSFFQTNSMGAEKLYQTVKDFISDSENKIIFDLYCGTGTIAQIVSYNAKQVIGIEIVPEAITAAIENARLNNIQNCKFIVGDVLKIVDELEQKPDIIIVDPPRDGNEQLQYI